MTKIKVIHLVEDLKLGGLEKVVASIALGLNKDIYDVEIWCLVSGGEVANDLVNKKMAVKIIGIKNYCNPYQIWILARLLRKRQVIILHTHGYFASTFGRLANFISRIPIVVCHVHTIDHRLNQRNILIERFLSFFTSKIICISNAVKRFVIRVEKISQKKVKVIYNGIEDSAVSSSNSNNFVSLRQLFGFDEKHCVGITVASLTHHKGHRVLIDALKSISDQIQNLRYLIVGDGPLLSELETYVESKNLSSKIIFTGKRQDIFSLLKMADFFVLPSTEREGLSIALIEAMSTALPVIGTRVGGIPEVIEENVNGLLIDPKNPDELAGAISRFIRDRTLMEKMGKMGKRIYLSKFLISKMIGEIEKMYGLLLLKDRIM